MVAEVLNGEHVHLSAEAIHASAQEMLPEISLATVYNTLNELVAMGEVLEVSAGAGPKRYDPNVATAHHHLVCTSCGALWDVFSPATDIQQISTDELHGFVLTGVEITFQGVCPTCNTAKQPAGV